MPLRLGPLPRLKRYGADAEKIVRKELGVEDPKKKRKEWDSKNLRGISTPASPGASGNGSVFSSPSKTGGGTGSDEYKQQRNDI